MIKWNVLKCFYQKGRCQKINPAVKRKLYEAGYYVVSFDEAQQIIDKYIVRGMMMYHDRYMKGGKL
jgi:hypothetical protein